MLANMRSLLIGIGCGSTPRLGGAVVAAAFLSFFASFFLSFVDAVEMWKRVEWEKSRLIGEGCSGKVMKQMSKPGHVTNIRSYPSRVTVDFRAGPAPELNGYSDDVSRRLL